MTNRISFIKYFTTFSLIFFINSEFALSNDLSKLFGDWKHREKPVWININPDTNIGKGIIIKNDDDPTSIGKFLFIDLLSDEDRFSGKIYVPQLGRFHPMKAEISDSGNIKVLVKVGFIKRTVYFDKQT